MDQYWIAYSWVKFVLEFLLVLWCSVVCLLKRPDQLNQRHNFTKLHKNSTGISCTRFLLYSCKTCNVTLYPIFSLKTEYKEVKQNPVTLRSATANHFLQCSSDRTVEFIASLEVSLPWQTTLNGMILWRTHSNQAISFSILSNVMILLLWGNI